MTTQEEYLGDGLYVSFDGFGYKLRAPRENGDHWVYLEIPRVLAAFDRFRKGVEDLRREGNLTEGSQLPPPTAK